MSNRKMIIEKMLYSLNDVAIMPSSSTRVEHRCECNPYMPDGMLPLFTAPMSTVVNSTNYNKFIENNINPILPRTEDIQMRLQKMNNVWCAFSLAEFKLYFLDTYANNNGKPMYVLIDIANGGMVKLLDYIKDAKKKYNSKIVIMAGNVANPETYVNLSLAGADYVRLSVGTGGACTTSPNTGIHYPMASLIDKCRQYYDSYLCNSNELAFIVADGGMKGYGDIIKALALGAHFVMCGSIFNKMLESAAYTSINDNGFICKIDQYSQEALNKFKEGYKFEKEFYGMSTKKAQKEMGNKTLKTGEGLITYRPVEYTMEGWVDNFISYLRSAMSYTNCLELVNFCGKVTLNIISNNAYQVINK